MKYYVYVSSNDSILQVTIDSEGEPEQRKPFLFIGDSRFRAEDVMAVVPESEFEGSRSLVPGRG